MSHIKSGHVVSKSWFLSESGKRISFYAANVVTSSVLFGHLLPHTVFVSKYRDFVRLYSKGFSVPVPDKVAERFEKTLDLLQIDQQQRNLYKPFITCGFDTFSAGTYGRFGIHIGIPVNFTYESTDTIDKSKIKVNQESVIWDTDEGKQLLNALVVPENGQIYAMAMEIKLRESWKLFFDTFYAVMACTFTYVGSSYMNNKFNLYTKPRGVRFVGYTMVSLFSLVNYFMCKDLTQNIYENKIDQELKTMDPVFAEGGKQFYTQILERNKALRVLMGKEGESTFTVLGNENTLFRTKHRPIVQRKAFFEEESTPEQANGSLA